MLTITNEDNMALMARYPDKYFDIAIIDPPYGTPAEGGALWEKWSHGRFGGRFDKYFDNKKVNHAAGGGRFAKYGDGAKHWDIAPNENFFNELFRVSKNQIIWGGNYFPLPPSRNFIVWRKLTFSESFSMAMVEQAWTNLKGNAKYFECMPQDKERFHPTQKPVELYAWLLSHYCKPGWKILDTHMGSGSIAIACHNAGFDLTACEIDKVYFDKAMERINKHMAQQHLFDPKETFTSNNLFEDGVRLKIIRVFPRRTKATPIDEFAIVGEPNMFSVADRVYISVTFTWDMQEAERLYRIWKHIAPTEIGGPATGARGGDFTPGVYLKKGYVITSRGCPNKCWFCNVWIREGALYELPITSGFNVLDDNFLSCSDNHIKSVFNMLSKQKERPQFTGGWSLQN